MRKTQHNHSYPDHPTSLSLRNKHHTMVTKIVATG